MQEWYLMKSPPRYGDDEFDLDIIEAFESAAGCDVEVYNYNHSIHFSMRCVVENRTQDTQLNALIRYFLFPIGTITAGMYVKYAGRFWIVNAIVDNNGVYEKAVAKVCNVVMAWLDDLGIPHIRYASALNATQYNNGETSARYYDFRTDQLVLTCPDDEDSLSLENGKRFVLDKRTRIYEKTFDENVTEKTGLPLITYQITRMDNTLYDYTDSGVINLMVTQDEQHDMDGYYVINGKGYWLAERPTDKSYVSETPKLCEILYDEKIVYIGAGETVFVANFITDDEDEDIEFEWDVISDNMNSLVIDKYDKTISISTNDNKLANKDIILRLMAKGYEEQQLKIQIKSYF